jgi:hypothetical protein
MDPAALAQRQLKKTETAVRELNLAVVNVLVVSKFWGCFSWLNPVLCQLSLSFLSHP